MVNDLTSRITKSGALPINEIIKDKYSTPKDYLNIINSYFATTGNRLVENNFPNKINNTAPKVRISINNITHTSFNFN